MPIIDFALDGVALLGHVLGHVEGHIMLEDEELHEPVQGAWTFHLLELQYEFRQLVPVLAEERQYGCLQFIKLTGFVGFFEMPDDS